MQKLLIVFLIILSIGSFAQGTVKNPIAVKKSVKAMPLALKNQSDSFSYAIGVSISNFYKEQGIGNINSGLVTKAMNDCKAGKAGLDDSQVNNIIMAYMQQKRSEKSSGTRKAGEAFLAENKKKEGVITTASGLQYTIIKEGTGPMPAATDKVKVHYHGTLIDGVVFESSVQRGEPIVYAVNGFVSGWIEALQMMPVGSKWKLFIPSNLAYGDNDSGPLIKAGSTLIFEIELLEIMPK
ncbi:MAG: FKBP-type peptidyl-prolyl cis-trans isomerase [Chitinophagaceae bacterium]